MLFAGALALLVAIPIVAVASSLFVPRYDVWRHLWHTQLLPLAWNTARLVVGVGLCAGTLGVALGWLVATRRFPLRDFFDWALVLPMAVPAYVIGFVVLALFDFAGPVQTWLREVLGPDLRLPELRSFGGIVMVMSLVYYPYVYLLARSAFAERSVGLIEAARSLGQSSRAAFWRLALPLARPAIAAGVGLALLETLADFGTVSLFNYPTFTVAIYRVWFGMFDREAAAQLALVLMAGALLALWLERRARGRARYAAPDTAPLPPLTLGRSAGWLATLACGLTLGVGFAIPAGVLGTWTVRAVLEGGIAPGYTRLIANTMGLAVGAAAITVGSAVILAFGLRRTRGGGLAKLAALATAGYAAPGSVVAVGVLLVLALLDRAVLLAVAPFGLQVSFLLATSAVGLLYAYVVRFLAVAFLPVQAGVTRIPVVLDEAARGLGAGGARMLRELHAPLLRGPLLTATILVVVEVMKEMPATMLIRPFGFDTLAVEIWQRTNEALWVEAAPPALAIVAAGSVLVLWLTRLRRTGALPWARSA